MDGETLSGIRQELESFTDPELWVLLDLIVSEMQDRTLLDDPDRMATEPLTLSNRPD